MYCSLHPSQPHSFPTRRSSDLAPGYVAFRRHKEGLRHGAGISKSGSFNQDVVKLLPALHQVAQNAEEFASHGAADATVRSEEHTSELQSRLQFVCRLLLEKKRH